MARRVALTGDDMTLDGHIGLNLWRGDGRKPAMQGGRFSPSEAMRSPGGLEQSVILDRLDGGVGAVERMVPHTYPLAIDGCTRYSRAWTPAGEIIDIPPLPPYAGRPPVIKAMLTWKDTLIIAAGGIIYKLIAPYYDIPQVMGMVGPAENVVDLISFEGVLVASTENFLSAPSGAPSSELPQAASGPTTQTVRGGSGRATAVRWGACTSPTASSSSRRIRSSTGWAPGG